MCITCNSSPLCLTNGGKLSVFDSQSEKCGFLSECILELHILLTTTKLNTGRTQPNCFKGWYLLFDVVVCFCYIVVLWPINAHMPLQHHFSWGWVFVEIWCDKIHLGQTYREIVFNFERFSSSLNWNYTAMNFATGFIQDIFYQTIFNPIRTQCMISFI